MHESATYFKPQWHPDLPGDRTLEGCLWGAWEYPTDTLPLRIVADRLDDLGVYDRAAWVRTACDLWDEAVALQPGDADWSYDDCHAALTQCGVTHDAETWRLAGLWGALLSACAPTGDGTGRMHETWADARVYAIHRWLWLWGCGLIDQRQARAVANWAAAVAPQVRYQSIRHEYAATLQARALVSLADAAARQASAATLQARALVSLADAAAGQLVPSGAVPRDSGRRDAPRHVWQRVQRYARSLWCLVSDRVGAYGQ